MYEKLINEFLPIDLGELRKPGFIQMMLDQRDEQIKRVESKRGFRKQETCPISGSSEVTTFCKINDWLTVQYCKELDYGFASHFPNFVEDVYDSDNYLDSAVKSYDATREYRKQRFGKERVSIIQKFKKTGKVLDIGCGTGWCLEAFKDAGYDVVGQELSPQLASFTQENFKIPTYNCSVSQIEDSFDFITMFDLIEHVPDPVELLTDCQKILNPGGVILAFTPHLDSYGIREMKEFSSLVIPPSHLHYFTPKSARKLSELVDLEFVFCETRGMDIADLASLYELRGDQKSCDSFRENFDSLQACVDQAGCANHMRFVLRLS